MRDWEQGLMTVLERRAEQGVQRSCLIFAVNYWTDSDTTHLSRTREEKAKEKAKLRMDLVNLRNHKDS